MHTVEIAFSDSLIDEIAQRKINGGELLKDPNHCQLCGVFIENRQPAQFACQQCIDETQEIIRSNERAKMKAQLEQKWIDHLKDLPESGMGYQTVNVIFADGTSCKTTVYNCSYMVLLPSEADKEIVDIALSDD